MTVERVAELVDPSRRNRHGRIERLADMLRTVTFVLLTVILVACGATSESPVPSASPGPAEPVDAAGSWVLLEGTAGGQQIPIVEGSGITLEIEGATVSGRSACNLYSGELMLVDGVVRIGQLGGTEMGCDAPIMESESAYLAALGSVQGARREGEALILLGPDVELRFGPPDEIPTAELIGTTWILDGLVQGDAVASTIGDPATLELRADGTFEGSSGCRELRGDYAIEGDMVNFTVFTLDGECAGGPADQDSHVVDVLRDGFRASIEGQQLTLTSADDRGLIYLAAPADEPAPSGEVTPTGEATPTD